MKEVSENEEAILHLARALETGERDGFLTTACGQDRELRKRVTDLAFSPNGEMLAASADEEVWVW